MDTIGLIAWSTGKVITLLAIVACLIANAFWFVSDKQGYIFELSTWPMKNLHRTALTYIYLATSLLLSGVSIAYVFQSPGLMHYMIMHPNIVIICTVILMSILTTMLELIPNCLQYNLLKNIFWLAHSTVMGPSLAYFGSYICMITYLSTGCALALATLVAFMGPKDLHLIVENQLSYIYFTVTVSSFLCILFSPPTTSIGVLLLSLNFYGGMFLYFSVFIVNTQYFLKEVHREEFDPIYTSCVMFLCSLNLYLRIAMYYVVELTSLTVNA